MPPLRTSSQSEGNPEVETTAKGMRSLPNAAQLAEQVGMPVCVVVDQPPVPA